MKNLHLLFLSLSLSVLASCNSSSSTSEAEETEKDAIQILNPYTEDGVDSSIVAQMGHLNFVDTVHDFGNMREGETVEWDAEYTNTGNGNLVIHYAKSSCGCTVPKYKKDPIKPGESGTLKVTFDATAKSGQVDKEVTVETNGFPNTYKLRIKANVMASNNSSSHTNNTTL